MCIIIITGLSDQAAVAAMTIRLHVRVLLQVRYDALCMTCMCTAKSKIKILIIVVRRPLDDGNVDNHFKGAAPTGLMHLERVDNVLSGHYIIVIKKMASDNAHGHFYTG